ncbi:sensor domain-containing diguanylate cyclase [Luteimonas sp. TWI1437]|uniref:GGDEF domain-containing protein n=1 Tax=unclassified Luteimonas TaxID=2629088 RepID=UPI003209A6CD
MMRPDRPVNEAERQAALDAYRILDTPREAAYDDLVRVAAAICDAPIAAITLVDRDRQWVKAVTGFDAVETPRDESFCAQTILTPDQTLVVEDATRDVRFRHLPMVTGAPGVRFYAGAPLRSADGHALGALCIVDSHPRQLDDTQREALEALSRQASRLMELHRVSGALHLQLQERAWYEQQLLQYQQALELQNADLAEQSTTDPLTGLANRRGFSCTLEQAIGQARAQRAPLSIAVVDIDHFKAINDAHGHAEGDRVLQLLGALLRETEAARGRIARLGGEEFVRLLPGCSLSQAVEVCDAMRASVAAMRSPFALTVSIGVADLAAADDAAALLSRADAALYQAKRSGRNRVCARPASAGALSG